MSVRATIGESHELCKGVRALRTAQESCMPTLTLRDGGDREGGPAQRSRQRHVRE